MKKKGFTLIELLAVVVVLAIIAIVAIPQILGIVEKAKKNSAEDSAYGYLDAVEKQIALNFLNNNLEDDILDGELSIDDLKDKYKLKIKDHTEPSDGTVTILNGKVSSATLKISGYEIICQNSKCVAGNKTKELSESEIKLAVKDELQIIENRLATSSVIDGVYDLKQETAYLSLIEKVHAKELEILGDVIDVSGLRLTNGWVEITNKKITDYSVMMQGYTVTHNNNTDILKKGNNVKVKPRITEDSLTVTLTDDTELTGLQRLGTPLKLKFKASIDNGTITGVTSPENATYDSETGEITYVTNGTEIAITFEITGTISSSEVSAKRAVSLSEYYIKAIEAPSLLKAIENNNFENNSYTTIIVNNIMYHAHVYNYDDNLNLTANQENGEAVDTIVSYGDISDVATETTDAQNMVVLKVNGNLTVGEKVTLTTYASELGYGGPKGFLIYVTGTITNNGEVSMTKRGARAVGQDVYLWQNANGSYEKVPAFGPDFVAGSARTTSSQYRFNGIAGIAGSNRSTGGGGSGGATHGDNHSGYLKSGASGIGTSYSGGTGGGAAGATGGGSNAAIAQEGQPNGGKGGYGAANSGTTSSSYSPHGDGGGAGNPGGKGAVYQTNSKTKSSAENGENGTGGLLIIYANSITNNGKITSNGANGGSATGGYTAGGGASGGGSINIFHNLEYTNNNLVEAKGGIGGQATTIGGAGGTGSIAIGKIVNGTYTDTYHNWSDETE